MIGGGYGGLIGDEYGDGDGLDLVDVANVRNVVVGYGGCGVMWWIIRVGLQIILTPTPHDSIS